VKLRNVQGGDISEMAVDGLIIIDYRSGDSSQKGSHYCMGNVDLDVYIMSQVRRSYIRDHEVRR